ncbi:MAG: DUF1622 domain-containing protein [Actinomycetota bacterium]
MGVETAAHAPGWFLLAVSLVARSLEGLGVFTIAASALWATIVFARQGLRNGWSMELYHCYRSQLGRGILVGLEFLVGADIINTVAVAPTIKSAAALGLIVLIRTFLSFSLEVEINGRWPWTEAEARAATPAGADSPPLARDRPMGREEP